MAGRQVDFPERQRHSKTLELVLWAIAGACIVFVVLAIFLVSGEGPAG
jgi:hypothetical protein